MRKTVIVVMALLVLCLLAGTPAVSGSTQLSMDQPLTAQQVHALLQSDPSVVMIDARDNAEYTGALPTDVSVGHIPGAYNVPYDGDVAAKLYRFPEKNRPYICYCDTPDCPNAGGVADIMWTSGYTNLTYMSSGVEGWAAQGYSFEQGQDPGGIIPPAPTTIPPAVLTSYASNITTTSAQLNGNLTSLGTAGTVTVSFDWGPSTSYGNTTTPQTMSGTGVFSANISGLDAATTIHFRARVVGDGTAYGTNMTFSTGTIPPAVMTGPASNITVSSAQLNGNLTSLGTAGSVTVSFEWGATTSYGNATTPQSVSGTGAFSASISGLAAATTIHFRAKVMGDGTAYGSDMTFTTSTTPNAGAVSTGNATSITGSSAQLNGNLTSLGTADSVSVFFDWGPTTSYGNTTTPQTMSDTGAFSASISGLAAAITIHFRAKVVGNGTAYGSDMTFTTSTTPNAGAVSTGDATNVTGSSAQLNGNLTSLGAAGSVIVSFDWGPSTSYGNTTTPQTMSGTGAFSASINGLASATTIHFRAKVVGDGTAYGSDMTFTTGTIPPAVMTGEASNTTSSSAQLNGNLTSLGTAGSVTVFFDWGPTTSYGNTTTPQTMSGTGAFSASISGLDAATTIHFRAKVVGDGATYGSDMTFTTGTIPPAVMTGEATDITGSSAQINGNLTSLGTAGSATVSFDWGPTTSYGNTTTPQTVSSTGTFSASICCLDAATTIHFRAKVVGNGTVYGSDMTFTTNADSGGMPTWAWVVIGLAAVGAVGIVAFPISRRLMSRGT